MRAHPFLEEFRAIVGAIALAGPRPREELDATFEAARAARFPDERPLRFVAPERKPRRRKREAAPVDLRESYDGLIALRREVPTRAGDLHDHCNFVVWVAFPRAKRAIHERQLRAKEAWVPAGSTKLPGARTREQDALTLFDEGGVVLVQDDSGGAPTLFSFGHALLEHFCRSDTEIAATSMRVVADPCSPDAVDRAIESRVRDPSSFVEPGLDGLVVLTSDGRFRPSPKVDSRSTVP